MTPSAAPQSLTAIVKTVVLFDPGTAGERRMHITCIPIETGLTGLLNKDYFIDIVIIILKITL